MAAKDLKVKVEKNKVILISYSIFNKAGQIIEARSPENPIEFLVGHGQILKALEEKLLGHTKGYKGDFVFSAEEAHGPYKKELLVEMKKDQFPEDVEVKKGMKFESRDPQGEPVALHVLSVEGDKVLVDGNHPLAGEDLRFDVTILDVRSAAKEEIRRGQTLSNMSVEKSTVH